MPKNALNGVNSMRGRPMANFWVPNVWSLLNEIDYSDTHVGLNKAYRKAESTGWSAGSGISNATIKKAFNRRRPQLVSEETADVVVDLINHHRTTVGLERVSASSEIVPFEFRVVGFGDVLGGRTTEAGIVVQDLAIQSSLPFEIVLSVVKGRIVTAEIANSVAAAGQKYGNLTVEQCRPNRRLQQTALSSENLALLVN